MKRLLIGAALAGLLLLETPLCAQTIDKLGSGGALTGTEKIPMFQTANPAVTTTPNAISTFLGSAYLPLAGGTMTGDVTFTNSSSAGALFIGQVPDTTQPGTSRSLIGGGDEALDIANNAAYVDPANPALGYRQTDTTYNSQLMEFGQNAFQYWMGISGQSTPPIAWTQIVQILWTGIIPEYILRMPLHNYLGTITASYPQYLTETWNASGVAFQGYVLNVTNTASAAGSLVAEWQIGGVDKVSFSPAGLITANSLALGGCSISADALCVKGSSSFGSASFSYGSLVTFWDVRVGDSLAANEIILAASSGGPIISYGSTTSSDIVLYNSTETSFGKLQFGGLTAAFPAIKRDGTGLDIRLADDSAYAPIAAASYAVGATPGASCASGTLISGITVVNGIVTAIAGTGC